MLVTKEKVQSMEVVNGRIQGDIEKDIIKIAAVDRVSLASFDGGPRDGLERFKIKGLVFASQIKYVINK